MTYDQYIEDVKIDEFLIEVIVMITLEEYTYVIELNSDVRKIHF